MSPRSSFLREKAKYSTFDARSDQSNQWLKKFIYTKLCSEEQVNLQLQLLQPGGLKAQHLESNSQVQFHPAVTLLCTCHNGLPLSPRLSSLRNLLSWINLDSPPLLQDTRTDTTMLWDLTLKDWPSPGSPCTLLQSFETSPVHAPSHFWSCPPSSCLLSSCPSSQVLPCWVPAGSCHHISQLLRVGAHTQGPAFQVCTGPFSLTCTEHHPASNYLSLEWSLFPSLFDHSITQAAKSPI